jgi:hypothetical protein
LSPTNVPMSAPGMIATTFTNVPGPYIKHSVLQVGGSCQFGSRLTASSFPTLSGPMYRNRPAKRIPQAGAGVISCGRNLCGRRASKSSIFSA